jgi:hypothetical protein
VWSDDPIILRGGRERLRMLSLGSEMLDDVRSLSGIGNGLR